jgi:hypothetical protein
VLVGQRLQQVRVLAPPADAHFGVVVELRGGGRQQRPRQFLAVLALQPRQFLLDGGAHLL